jgi:hypothetical protein
MNKMNVKVQWQGEKLSCVVNFNPKNQHGYVVSVTSKQREEISTGNCSLALLSHIMEEARKKSLVYQEFGT